MDYDETVGVEILLCSHWGRGLVLHIQVVRNGFDRIVFVELSSTHAYHASGSDAFKGIGYFAVEEVFSAIQPLQIGAP
jgi:hypothetical protein